MNNPFADLGVSTDASRDQVRAAYHAKVKRCHPDLSRDAASQQVAQEALIRLNVIYQETLRRIAAREVSPCAMVNPRQVVRKLLAQGNWDGALRILSKVHDRDADWYALRGDILLKKGDPDAAHLSFRAAIRLSPEDAQLRASALAAAVMMRRRKTFRGRVERWARSVVGR